LRVPALAVTRMRGRTFAAAAVSGAEALLDLAPTSVRAPAARRLHVTSVRNPLAWTAAVETAVTRLRAGAGAQGGHRRRRDSGDAIARRRGRQGRPRARGRGPW